MSEIIQKVGDRHGIIYRLILLLLTVAVLVALFPQDAKFNSDYYAAKPWKHDDLYASFEFAIQKSDAELANNKEEVLARVYPYYYRNDEVKFEQLETFLSLITNDWDNSEYKADGLLTLNKDKKDSVALVRHYKAVEGLLKKVFDKGVIQIDVEHEEENDRFLIMLYSERDGEERELGELHSIQSAYNYIENKLKKVNQIDLKFLLTHVSEVLKHNVTYDDHKTLLGREQALLDANIQPTRGMVSIGEKVVGRGEIVTADVFQKLESFKGEYQRKMGGSKNEWLIMAGQALLCTLLILALFFFLNLFRKEIFAAPKKLIFVLLLIILIVGTARAVVAAGVIDIYIVPLCLVPIILRAFYDTIMAFFVHIIVTLLISFFAPSGYEFVFLHLIAGSLLVFSIVNLRRRAQFFLFVAVIFFSYALTYLGHAIVQEGNLEEVNWMQFAWFAGNAGLSLLAYPLIYVFEKLFGFISEITLMELSDTNNPLLRDLTSQAPGTFQHTLQVANLAEDAIFEIGGNALLVRVGALYHDIGKMEQPMYYIENQSGVNPHDELAYEESAGIIIDHVIKGIELARRYNLPDEVTDFIRTHHGTTRTEYFYRMKVKELGDEDLVNASDYTYPGPLPYSKETAVLMMADSVEAASRSLKEYNAESIDKLVEGIIGHQLNLQQFINADITLKDITKIKKMFKRKLMNIYHVRVEYPK
jgi:putative nucleotidyltransferase with HDIG domain